MEHVTGSTGESVVRSRRAIGPIGTASRAAGGALAVALPIIAWGIAWWDLAASVVAFPLIAGGASALVARVYRRYAPDRLERPDPIFDGAACAVLAIVIGAATLVTFVTPADAVAIWVFFGASMLLAAAKGYGGCEVLAIPNLITGRRDQVGCMIYGPIDVAEARRRPTPARAGP